MKTVCGGWLTLFTSLLLYAYFLYKLKIMIFYEGDSISLTTTDTDYEGLGERNVGEMNLLFYFFAQSTKPENFLAPIILDINQLHKYMRMSTFYSGYE